jgi:hypothetical protein
MIEARSRPGFPGAARFFHFGARASWRDAGWR